MDNPSFAEIKERFSKMNVLPYPKPRSSTIENELSSSNPPVVEKLKTETSNQPSDNAKPRVSDSNTASSQTSDETASTFDARVARLRQQGGIGMPSFKKAPVPLPRPVIQQRKENTSSERPTVLQEQTSNQGPPSDVNTVISSNPSSAVPSIIIDSDENTYAELSNESINSSSSSAISGMQISYEPFEKPSTVLPNPVSIDQRRNSHPESLSMSLDAMLPLKCMFFEFETTINEYQRRDPRTIIYPKIKATMPKITSNEINTLQRYSNT